MKILFDFFRRQKRPIPKNARTTVSEPKKTLRDYPDDETLRENHPAVQDAWEQYQMLIKLHGGLTVEQRRKLKPKRRAMMK